VASRFRILSFPPFPHDDDMKLKSKATTVVAGPVASFLFFFSDFTPQAAEMKIFAMGVCRVFRF